MLSKLQGQCNICIYRHYTTIFISSILAIYCTGHEMKKGERETVDERYDLREDSEEL